VANALTRAGKFLLIIAAGSYNASSESSPTHSTIVSQSFLFKHIRHRVNCATRCPPSA
jgi:hypothetical protein